MLTVAARVLAATFAVCHVGAHHHCTIRPATLQTGDREGRPYIMWRLCHWGAGAIVGADLLVCPIRHNMRRYIAG